MKLIKKRCVKCGNVAMVVPRERKCKQLAPKKWKGATRYWCYGQLVPTLKAVKKLSAVEYAEKKLAYYEKQVEAKERQKNRLQGAIYRAEKKAFYYKRRVVKLKEEAAQVEHEQQLHKEGRFKTIHVQD